MDVFIFGGSLILFIIICWLIIKCVTYYINKQHDKFIKVFKMKFNNSIINKMKQLKLNKEVLDEYYDTHVRYATYETIELYRKYEKDNIHQKLREQYYEVMGLEDYVILRELDIHLFAERLEQAESDLNTLKDNIVNQIESRYIK